MKIKRILIIAISILILASIATPWYLLTKAQRDKEVNQVITSFVSQYGLNNRITRLSQPDKLYMAYWTSSDNYTHASLLIDGMWVEIARLPSR